jgi:hypothetical protein
LSGSSHPFGSGWLRCTQASVGSPGFDKVHTRQQLCQADAGGEDSIYYIRFRTGNTANTGTILSTFVISSGAGLYINTDAEAPTTNNITLRSDIVFGAGTYSYVFQGTNANNESHIVELERYKSNSNNASGWTVLGAAGKMQFYIEDIGEWIGQA